MRRKYIFASKRKSCQAAKLTLDEWASSLKTAISAADRELEKITSREESRRESQSNDQFQTQARHTAVHQNPTSSESFQTPHQLNGNAQNYEEQGKAYLPRTFTTSELNSVFEALGPEMQLTGEQEGLAMQYQVPSWGSEAYNSRAIQQHMESMK